MRNSSVELGSDLRNLIRRYRTDRERWGKPHGLSQREAALRIGKSQVWWRQIETGYVPTAPAVTLADMCDMLGIDTELIRALAYVDVADAMDAIAMARSNEIPDHLVDDPMSPVRDPFDHIKATPGVSEQEVELLLDTLRQLRGRVEPLGRDIWRRGKTQV